MKRVCMYEIIKKKIPVSIEDFNFTFQKKKEQTIGFAIISTFLYQNNSLFK